MAILQISKIQQRTGNLIDLPQLDEAEFGWASDAKRLFIGKTTPNENIEVLTSYSTINFSQINGVVGNINISNVTLSEGQVLTYDGSEWVNRGGDVGGLITLGDAPNVKISGGAIGYVLQTDGLGNLSWTPKSAVTATIQNATKATTCVITTASENFFPNGAVVTISNVTGMTQLNGNSYYIKVVTSSSFQLYSDAGLTVPVNSTSFGTFPYATVTDTSTSTNQITVSSSTPFTVNDPVVFGGSLGNSLLVSGTVYYVKAKGTGWIQVSATLGGPTFSPNSATGLVGFVYVTGSRVLSSISGSGTSGAAGAQGSIQYNNSGLSAGDATFIWDSANTTLRVTGANGNVVANNISSNNIITATRFISNVATGVAPPLVVTSSSRVANLNVSYANVSDFGVVTSQSSGTYFPVFVSSSSTGNRALGVNSNISFNAATGNLSVSLLNVSGNANISNLGVSGTTITTAISTGSTTTQGNITGNWALTSGSILQSTDGDLAEYYDADDVYLPGTVLMFGGSNEVTVADDETRKVAGVVSTNPAYVMNISCSGLMTPVALQGRVPCKVKGKISKGDMMVSAGDGYAKASNDPALGSVIGKALEDFDGISGVIEIAVGRL